MLLTLFTLLSRLLSMLSFGMAAALLVFTVPSHAQVTDADKFKVALLVAGDNQMKSYSDMFADFEQQFGHSVEVKFFSDITFKKHLDSWIQTGEYDLLYWQGGQRLERLVQNDQIISLNKLIDANLLSQYFRQNALDAVTYNNQIYAVPLAQYIWGMYYNEALFKRLGVTPPTDWHGVKLIAQRCKQAGIAPFFQPTSDNWPTLAWLDYFALDVGGHELRDALLANKSLDKQAIETLAARFRYLTTNDMFFAPSYGWRWEQAAPALLRQQACMTLIGQFAEGQLLEMNAGQIKFFPFPYSNPANQRYEVAPMEVFVVPVTSNKLKVVTEFLSFFAGYSRQASVANELGWLSVSNNPKANPDMSDRMQVASKRINLAKHLVQYFDRDTEQAHADKWAEAIVKSISEGSNKPIETLLKQP